MLKYLVLVVAVVVVWATPKEDFTTALQQLKK